MLLPLSLKLTPESIFRRNSKISSLNKIHHDVINGNRWLLIPVLHCDQNMN
jgi:hypothetical protein